jgi:hypothetical protein
MLCCLISHRDYGLHTTQTENYVKTFNTIETRVKQLMAMGTELSPTEQATVPCDRQHYVLETSPNITFEHRTHALSHEIKKPVLSKSAVQLS